MPYEFDHSPFCGWIDHPTGVQYQLARMPYPKFADAAPNLMQGDYGDKDILLYKAWKDVIGNYPEYVAQEIGDCFPAGTKVVMADGSEKFIEDVRPGDEVVSHKNRRRKVLSTLKKRFSGELVQIVAKGYNRKVMATPDHRFVTLPNFKPSRNSGKDETTAWCPIAELAPGANVMLPWGVTSEGQDVVIDVAKHIANPIIKGDKVRGKGSGRWINRYIEVTPRLCWLFGIYLAEGGVTNGPTGNPCRVDFNLNGQEFYEVDNVVAAIKDIFGTVAEAARVPSKPNVMYARCANTAVAQVFHSLFPGNLYSKEIPGFVFNLSRECRMACLRGWIDGDGCTSQGGSFKVNGISSSHALADGMARLAISCGLTPKLHQRKKAAHQRVAAKSIDMYGEHAYAVYPEYRDDGKATLPGAATSRHTTNGIAVEVSRMDRIPFDGNVYCIEVEGDHGFIANGYAVHNCTSQGSGHVVDLTQCIQIALGHTREEYKETSTEALYGAGREMANMLNRWIDTDGCYGAAMARAVTEIGVVPREIVGAYSGRRAKQWGREGIPANIRTEADKHKIKTTSMVTTLAELDAALANGYVAIVCSNQGFTMQRDADGFCYARGSWAHAMCIVAKRVTGKTGYLICQSWGPNVPSGPTVLDQPNFSFWVDPRTIAYMLSQQDSFVFSQFNGYPGRGLPSSWTYEGFA